MRKIRIFCMVLAVLLALPACGKKPAETSASTEQAAAETAMSAAETTMSTAETAMSTAETTASAAETIPAETKPTDAGSIPDHYAMGDAADSADAGNVPEKTSILYEAAKNAYKNQQIPEELMLTDLPLAAAYVSKAYESVTFENLQGGWINRYKEGDSEIVEILSVNGERGKIESYCDGIETYAWNGEGILSIEDRTDRNVCPAVRINSEEDGSNICTIYIRWVKDNSFYDGGFLNEWQRMDPEEFSYLMDTVTLDNLEGVWYSEFADDGGFYQDILTIEGDRATLLETIDGEVSPYWNDSGSAEIVMTEYIPGRIFPELLIKDEIKGIGTAGIYISHVSDNYFFDQGFCRYWYKVPKDISTYWGQ